MADCSDKNAEKLAELSVPVRNRYFYGKMLDVRHLEMEQDYFNRKRWLLNRLSLGSGVLCGLQVAVTKDGKQVQIGPGVAVDTLGREIIVSAPSPPIDPAQPTDDCGQPDGNRVQEPATVTLCIAYHECASEPVPVTTDPCDPTPGCAYSAVSERYRVLVSSGGGAALQSALCSEVFPENPAQGFDRRKALCEALDTRCEGSDDCVVVAQVTLDASGKITNVDSCGVRQRVYSNEVLLDLILCLAERVDKCCGSAHAASKTLVRRDGSDQTAPVGQAVAHAIGVEVLLDGSPSPGETVEFRVTSGGGTIGSTSSNQTDHITTTTDAQGIASVQMWVMGPNEGVDTVSASVSGATPSSVEFSAYGSAVKVALPVIEKVEPGNAASFDPSKIPTKLKLKFSQPLPADFLNTPGKWLGVWQVSKSGSAGNKVTKFPVNVLTQLTSPTDSVEYELPLKPGASLKGTRYLVQIRVNAADLLDADFVGTKAPTALLDRVWNLTGTQTITDDLYGVLVDGGGHLPSGNQSAGGNFSSCFIVL
jgi:hypothetical protein